MLSHCRRHLTRASDQPNRFLSAGEAHQPPGAAVLLLYTGQRFQTLGQRRALVCRQLHAGAYPGFFFASNVDHGSGLQTDCFKLFDAVGIKTLQQDHPGRRVGLDADVIAPRRHVRHSLDGRRVLQLGGGEHLADRLFPRVGTGAHDLKFFGAQGLGKPLHFDRSPRRIH
ncbi:hypothetical protein D3C84_867990 [compost metagenome]